MSDASTPAIAIVGTDTGLAARPATPVQLAHACHRAGFDVVIPASWGDELIASECLRQLDRHDSRPAILCSCPFVARRLLAPGDELAPFFVSTVSPPVAAARYIRGLYGSSPVHITYLGACPGAADPSIDARLLPDEFFATLEERGIRVADEPIAFDSVIPPDRRRHLSLPGGAPVAERLAECSPPRAAFDIASADPTSELVDRLILKRPEVLDVARSFGCACSGIIAGMAPDRARLATAAMEPPRAAHPIVEPETVEVQIARPVAEQVATSRAEVAAPTKPAPASLRPAPRHGSHTRDGSRSTPRSIMRVTSQSAQSGSRRRQSPGGVYRAFRASVPRARSDEGEVYRGSGARRSPSRGLPPTTSDSLPAIVPDEHASTRQAAGPATSRNAVMQRVLLTRRVGLTPMLLGAAALLALLVAIFVLLGSHSAEGTAPTRTATSDSLPRHVTTDSSAGGLAVESSSTRSPLVRPARVARPRHHRAAAPRAPGVDASPDTAQTSVPMPSSAIESGGA